MFMLTTSLSSSLGGTVLSGPLSCTPSAGSSSLVPVTVLPSRLLTSASSVFSSSLSFSDPLLVLCGTEVEEVAVAVGGTKAAEGEEFGGEILIFLWTTKGDTVRRFPLFVLDRVLLSPDTAFPPNLLLLCTLSPNVVGVHALDFSSCLEWALRELPLVPNYERMVGKLMPGQQVM